MALLNNRRRKLLAALLAVGMATSLTACGTATSDTPTSSDLPDKITSAAENEQTDTVSGAENTSEPEQTVMDFSAFTNVTITGTDISALSADEQAVLYQQARYCQAMTEADTDTLSEIVASDKVFTHMSGRQQSKEEYLADIADGSLRYFTVGIENPVIEINGNYASVKYTSVLNANAYGATGTYRINGTHWFEKQDGVWIACNAPKRL